MATMDESFSKDITFPKVIRVTTDLELLTDWFKESDREEVVRLVWSSSSEGKGVGVNEFPTRESVHEKIDDPKVKLYICRDKSNNHLVSLFFIQPCSLSRSENSPNSGSYGFVSESYRGQGAGQSLIYLMKHIICGLGYRSVVGRQALTSRTGIPSKAAGATFMGIISKSVRMNKLNVVVDDVIVYYGYHWPPLRLDKAKIWNELKPVLPNLQVNERALSALNNPLPLPGPTIQLTLQESDEKYSIKEVPKDYFVTAEKMIRNAALEGYMIALDEFLDDGTWNRKFLRKSYKIGIYNANNILVGLALFGPSAICRSESVVMGTYVLIESSYRWKGLEQNFVQHLTKLAKCLDFEGVIFDVYRTETRFSNLLMDLGFKATGCLPECGYMKNAGFVDSLLLYKEFVIGSSKI